MPALRAVLLFFVFPSCFEFQNSDDCFFRDAQVVQNKQQHKRSVNCYLEGASDVPAAGKYPGQPKEQQDPARATANEAALQKGKPAGRTCRRRGGYNHRPHPIWEASDQRRTAKRHSD
jgi:hypothetical protein